MGRTACGFGDMDDPEHREQCLACSTAEFSEALAARLRPVADWLLARPWALLVMGAVVVALVIMGVIGHG